LYNSPTLAERINARFGRLRQRYMTNRASNPAATNVSAMREYEQAIASEPSMSIRDARLLREKINNMSRQRAPG
jgi:hypothetical protein